MHRHSWLVVVGICLQAACARHTAHGLSQTFGQPGEPKVSLNAPDAAPAPQPSVEEFVGKLRQLQPRATPAQPSAGVTTIEQSDPVLAAALAKLAASPLGSSHRAVADAYRNAGLLDRAYDHYTTALKMNRYDAQSFEGLARVWRDWGFSYLGLADAHRAIYFAPLSASAHNTLGTLLQALGQRGPARTAYSRALALDGEAAYTLNNLCYLSFLESKFSEALQECRAAMASDPTLRAAHNNLGLVYAATGHNDLAGTAFLMAGGPAAGAYNMGIVHLAQHQYMTAADEFYTAERAQPGVTDANQRARHATTLANRENGSMQ